MNEKKKDARDTYDFDKDVKYKREHYTKDDLIDTPYNKAKRYKIASEGVKPKTTGELEEKDFRESKEAEHLDTPDKES